MPLTATPNPVPYSSTTSDILADTSMGENATKLERQVNGGGYSLVAQNLSGAGGRSNYTSTFAAQGDVHDFKFYAGPDELNLTLQNTLTGVRRGVNKSVQAGGGALVQFKKSGSSHADAFVAGAALTDKCVIGDFDGDGKADVAFWRPSTGYWTIYQSSKDYDAGRTLSYQWGQSGDIPLAGDYDGDGRSDIIVFRPSTGDWWILKSNSGAFNTYEQIGFGTSGDTPFCIKAYGNARYDISVWRAGMFYVRKSTDGTSTSFGFGLSTDTPLWGDWDGDGDWTPGVWRAGTFYLKNSLAGGAADSTISFGLSSDTPIQLPGDYDDDNKSDCVIWRDSSNTLFVRRSGDAGTSSWAFGNPGDLVVTGDFDNDGKADPALYRKGVSGSATVSANVKRNRGLLSTVAGVATVTSAIKRNRGLVGSSAGATTHGTSRLRATWRLRSTVAGVASVSAPFVRRARPIAAASAGVASVSAPFVRRARPLASTVAGVATVASALIRRARPLASTVAGVASVSAPFVRRARPLAGSSAGVASVVAALRMAWALRSTVAGVASLTVRLNALWRLNAASAGVATVSAPFVRRARPIAATAAGVASVTVALNRLRGLLGASAGVASVASALIRRARPLASTVAGVATVSAPFVRRARPLVGSSAGVASVVSALRMAWALVGASAGVASLSVRLNALWRLRSTVTGVATVSAPFVRRLRPVAAASAGVASVSAPFVRRLRPIAAAAAGVATVASAPIRRARPLVGSSAGTSSLAVALRMTWGLHGSSAGSSSVSLYSRGRLAYYLRLWSRAMGLEQLGTSISFSVYYTANGLPLSGLTDVKVDVFNPAGTKIVNQASAAEIGSSACYGYTLTGPNVSSEGEYHAIFSTANLSADFRSLPDRFTVGRAGIENLDQTVGSRLPTSGYTPPPSASSIATTLLGSNTTGYGTGTVGNALNQVNAGPGVTVVSPVARDGYIEIVQGDDYLTANGRQLRFINNGGTWPSLSGATVTFYSAYALKERTGIRLDKAMSIVVASGVNQEVKLDLTDTDTSSLATGQNAYDWMLRAVLSDASIVTLASGKMTVLPLP